MDFGSFFAREREPRWATVTILRQRRITIENLTMVFFAEVYAILECAEEERIRCVRRDKLYIFTDSVADI